MITLFENRWSGWTHPMYQLQLRTCCSFFISSHTTCDSEVRNLFVIHFSNSVVKIVWYLVISSLFSKPTLHITAYSRKHRLWFCQHKGLLPYKLIFERNWIYTTTNIFTSWHACMSITSEFYITIKTGTLFKKLVDWSTVSNNFSIFIFGIMWYWNRSVDFQKKKLHEYFHVKFTYMVELT